MKTVRPGRRVADVVQPADFGLFGGVGADLIVVGTRNRTLVERLVLGSVSTDVLHYTPYNVLVAK